jgi:hypothetical protein
LQRAQFGHRSEKLDPEEFNLAPADIEQAITANEADEEAPQPLRALLSAPLRIVALAVWSNCKPRQRRRQ